MHTDMTVFIVGHICASVESDLNVIFGALEFPRITQPQPFIRTLNLIPVNYFLIEYAVFKPYAVTVSRNIESSHRVEKTRGEPPETAVAKACVYPGLGYLVDIETQLFKCLLSLFFQT